LETVPSFEHPSTFISALFLGGDSRITANPITGVNKYLCPEVPAPNLRCASSCTASPVSLQGFGSAAKAFVSIVQASSPPCIRSTGGDQVPPLKATAQ
jgi:hypothetical protein